MLFRTGHDESDLIDSSPGRAIAVVLLVVVLVSACGGADLPSPSSTTTTPTSVTASVGATNSSWATSSASTGLQGAHVKVLGLWSGPEADSFDQVASAWEQSTGAVVDWEATFDMSGTLTDHLRTGQAPDIAILPNLSLMRRLADDGMLIPLDSVLDMEQIGRDYTPAWTGLGSHGGKLYGIFYKVADKATVWYDPKRFSAAGYRVPTTWKEMTSLADTMVADGRTPFSVVAAKGPASGWALTDWVSEIVLNACGPDVYDQWVAAELPWDQACIKRSFGMFAKLVSTKGYVLGGSDRIVSTGDDVAADPLFTDPPTAYMCYLASFAQAFIAANHPGLEPGQDYGFFDFPSITPEYEGAMTVGADIPVMVSDTPAARSFMAYLAGAQAQETWIRLGGFISVNRSVSLDIYQDPVARKMATELADATVSRFSAGDMMPPSLQRAWWGAMLDLVRDPRRVDEILDKLTAVAKDAR